DDGLVVDISFGGDFTEDHDHSSFASGLASNLGKWVLLETGIELQNKNFKCVLSTRLRVTNVRWHQKPDHKSCLVAMRACEAGSVQNSYGKPLTRMSLTDGF